MKEGREDRFRHVVANDEVSVGCTKVAGISQGALPERAVGVGELSVSRKRRSKDHRAPIERVLAGDLKLLRAKPTRRVRRAGWTSSHAERLSQIGGAQPR